MNTLVKKEIRLLLPIWLAAMVLAIGPAWRCAPENPTPVFTALLGMVILAVASFGREFAFGTFGLLLAQPISRSVLWKAKLSVLATALATLAAGWLFFGGLKSVSGSGVPVWAAIPLAAALAVAGGFCFTLLTRQTVSALAFTVLIPITIIIQALFVFERFHITNHIASGILATALGATAVLGIYWSHRLFTGLEETSGNSLPVCFFAPPAFRSVSARKASRRFSPFRALLRKEFGLQAFNLASMAGLFLIHLGVLTLRRIFLHTDRPQVDNLDAFLACFGFLWFIPPFLVAATSIAEERRLCTLEAQFCLPAAASRQYLLKFLFVLVCGGMLSATLFHFAETVGRFGGVRHDLLYALLANVGSYNTGGVLNFDVIDEAAALPLTLGASSAGLIFLFIVITGLAFYASTLAANTIEALGLGAAFFVLAAAGYAQRFQTGGFMPLCVCCAISLLVLALPWLGWQNLASRQSRLRLCLRNLLGVAATLALAAALASAIYFRVLETVDLRVPAHGSPRLSLLQPPPRFFLTTRKHVGLTLRRTSANSISYSSMPLSDERLCSLLFADGHLWIASFFPQTEQIAFGQFLSGNDWSETALSDHTIIGIRKDGSLWCSEYSTYPEDYPPEKVAAERNQPIVMHRVGSETHWKKVVAEGWFALLLQDDGSLWQWGPASDEAAITFLHPTATERHLPHPVPPSLVSSLWPRLDAFPLTRITTPSRWTDLIPPSPYGFTLAKAVDEEGRAWMIKANTWLTRENTLEAAAPPPTIQWDRAETWSPLYHAWRLTAQTPIAQDPWKSVWPITHSKSAAIRQDGTLWLLRSDDKFVPATGKSDQLEISAETDWRSFSFDRWPVGLKTNGSLWAYSGYTPDAPRSLLAYGAKPSRPGIWKPVDPHRDWVGTYGEYQRFALAADGSLWRWSLYEDRHDVASWLPAIYLSPSRRPQLLGNIFTSPSDHDWQMKSE